MEEVFYENIPFWLGSFEALKGQGHELGSRDCHLRRFIGFYDLTDNTWHQLSLKVLKDGMAPPVNAFFQLRLDSLQTQKGRRALFGEPCHRSLKAQKLVDRRATIR